MSLCGSELKEHLSGRVQGGSLKTKGKVGIAGIRIRLNTEETPVGRRFAVFMLILCLPSRSHKEHVL